MEKEIEQGVVELEKSEKPKVHFYLSIDGIEERIGQVVNLDDLNIPENATREEMDEIIKSAISTWAIQFINLNYVVRA